MAEVEDLTLTCAVCGTRFTFTADESRWMRLRFGDSFKMPRRCRPCRQLKRTQYEQREGA